MLVHVLILFLMLPGIGWYILSGPYAYGQNPLDKNDCYQIFSEHPLRTQLNEEQSKFLTEVFMPVLGRRSVYESPQKWRKCESTSSCIVFGSFGSHRDLRISWIDLEPNENNKPWIERRDDEVILNIPKGYDWSASKDNGKPIILQMLMGHPLHPYIANEEIRSERRALGEPELFLKQVQVDAIKVGKELMERAKLFPDSPSGRKYLVVAPTAVGKTEILMKLLAERIEKYSSQKLSIVLNDKIDLVEQLQKDIERLRGGDVEKFDIIKWGGDERRESVQSLLDRVKTATKPIVLVSTYDSLKLALKITNRPSLKENLDGASPAFSEQIKELRNALSMICIDEAHHAGAAKFIEIEKLLISPLDSRVFFLGVTATPMHRSTIIRALFGNQVFWAYIDSPYGFLRSGGSPSRSFDTVLRQSSLAVKAGELPPISDANFILSSEFDRDDVFTEGDHGARKILNPEIYKQLIKKLKPKILQFRKGFITVNSIETAEKFVLALQQEIPELKFRVYHSGNSSYSSSDGEFSISMEAIKNGQADFVVTVRKMDEGINIPDLMLWIDLNWHVGARAFLQRLGRISRLALGKHSSSFVTLLDSSENDKNEFQQLIAGVRKGVFQSPIDVKIEDESVGELNPIHSSSLDLDEYDLYDRVYLEAYAAAQEFVEELVEWIDKTKPIFGNERLPTGFETELDPSLRDQALRLSFMIHNFSNEQTKGRDLIEHILRIEMRRRSVWNLLRKFWIRKTSNLGAGFGLASETLLSVMNKFTVRSEHNRLRFPIKGYLFPISAPKWRRDEDPYANEFLMRFCNRSDLESHNKFLSYLRDKNLNHLAIELEILMDVERADDFDTKSIAEILIRWHELVEKYAKEKRVRMPEIEAARHRIRDYTFLERLLAEKLAAGIYSAGARDFFYELVEEFARKNRKDFVDALLMDSELMWVDQTNPYYFARLLETRRADDDFVSLMNKPSFRSLRIKEKLENIYFLDVGDGKNRFEDLITELRKIDAEEVITELYRRRENFLIKNREKFANILVNWAHKTAEIEGKLRLPRPISENPGPVSETEKSLSQILYGTRFGWPRNRKMARKIAGFLKMISNVPGGEQIHEVLRMAWTQHVETVEEIKRPTVEKFVDKIIEIKTELPDDSPIFKFNPSLSNIMKSRLRRIRNSYFKNWSDITSREKIIFHLEKKGYAEVAEELRAYAQDPHHEKIENSLKKLKMNRLNARRRKEQATLQKRISFSLCALSEDYAENIREISPLLMNDPISAAMFVASYQVMKEATANASGYKSALQLVQEVLRKHAHNVLFGERLREMLKKD